jgi:hypothetical protein
MLCLLPDPVENDWSFPVEEQSVIASTIGCAKKTNPGPILLYTDYMSQRPEKPYCRIQGKRTGLLHPGSIFPYQILANTE